MTKNKEIDLGEQKVIRELLRFLPLEKSEPSTILEKREMGKFWKLAQRWSKNKPSTHLMALLVTSNSILSDLRPKKKSIFFRPLTVSAHFSIFRKTPLFEPRFFGSITSVEAGEYQKKKFHFLQNGQQ